MEKLHKTDVIPEQKKGVKSTTEKKQEFQTALEAMAIFRIIKQRLLNVNNWGSYSSSNYELVRADGSHKTGLAEPMDMIKIDIPGPSSTVGEGYDWVQIEKIKDTENLFAIEVRATPKPGSDDTTAAHFYTKATTNTFSVERNGTEVKCAINGRNMVFNIKHKNLLDKIRNFVTGLFSEAGASKILWTEFLTNLMEGKVKSKN